MDLQRKWKSFRDSFRRELAKVKKAKSISAAETGRKEYMYFKQLFFLLPICETKHQEEGSFEGPAEGKGAEDQDQSSPPPPLQDGKRKPPASEEQLPQTSSAQTAKRRAREPPPLSARQKRRKTVASEGQLLRALAKSMERKAKGKELDDPDRHFLLSLLPHLKNIPEEVKLSVKGEFINILKRFRQQAAFSGRLYPPNHLCPSGLPSQSFPLQHNTGPSSAEPQQTLIPNIQCSHTNPQHSTSTGAPALTRLQPIRTPTPDSPAVSEAISPRSDGSSICDDYFL